MAKSRKYESTAEGPITVSVPGHSVHQFAPGDSVETDDPAVVAAFDANPDLSQVKAKKTK